MRRCWPSASPNVPAPGSRKNSRLDIPAAPLSSSGDRRTGASSSWSRAPNGMSRSSSVPRATNRTRSRTSDLGRRFQQVGLADPSRAADEKRPPAARSRTAHGCTQNIHTIGLLQCQRWAVATPLQLATYGICWLRPTGLASSASPEQKHRKSRANARLLLLRLAVRIPTFRVVRTEDARQDHRGSEAGARPCGRPGRGRPRAGPARLHRPPDAAREGSLGPARIATGRGGLRHAGDLRVPRATGRAGRAVRGRAARPRRPASPMAVGRRRRACTSNLSSARSPRSSWRSWTTTSRGAQPPSRQSGFSLPTGRCIAPGAWRSRWRSSTSPASIGDCTCCSGTTRTAGGKSAPWESPSTCLSPTPSSPSWWAPGGRRSAPR